MLDQISRSNHKNASRFQDRLAERNPSTVSPRPRQVYSLKHLLSSQMNREDVPGALDLDLPLVLLRFEVMIVVVYRVW